MTHYGNTQHGWTQVPLAQFKPAGWLVRFRPAARRQKELPVAFTKRRSWERFKNLLEKIAKADPWSAEQL